LESDLDRKDGSSWRFEAFNRVLEGARGKVRIQFQTLVFEK